MKNDSGVKMSTDLRKVLKKNPKAELVWKSLTPIARRDYITWINGAKKPETRERRIEKASSILAKGKRRPCCYAIVGSDIYRALSDFPKAKSTWKSLTPTERRDFVSWVDEVRDAETRRIRIDKICVMLAKGKRHF